MSCRDRYDRLHALREEMRTKRNDAAAAATTAAYAELMAHLDRIREQVDLALALDEADEDDDSSGGRSKSFRDSMADLDRMHTTPFDPDNDVPFSEDLQRTMGAGAGASADMAAAMATDRAMKWVFAVRMVQQLAQTHAEHKGRWRLQEVIGVGGTGVVVCSKDRVLKQAVAIKIVLPSQGTPVFGKDEQKRLKRERVAMQRINHPHVVKFHDAFFDESKLVYMMVMELAVGVSLQQLLDARGPLPQPKLTEIAAKLLSVLEELHSKNIIHLDIKPHNIMYYEAEDGTGTWTIKLIDFGLARAPSKVGEGSSVVGAHSTDLTTMGTQTQSIAGTLLYMPPE